MASPLKTALRMEGIGAKAETAERDQEKKGEGKLYAG